MSILTLSLDSGAEMTVEPKVYKGDAQRLVISLDVGTTFSGASYCLLDPGEVPKVFRVTRCAAAFEFL